jgi:hypothetical protein
MLHVLRNLKAKGSMVAPMRQFFTGLFVAHSFRYFVVSIECFFGSSSSPSLTLIGAEIELAEVASRFHGKRVYDTEELLRANVRRVRFKFRARDDARGFGAALGSDYEVVGDVKAKYMEDSDAESEDEDGVQASAPSFRESLTAAFHADRAATKVSRGNAVFTQSVLLRRLH